jgi:hypothetical protein
VTFRAANKSAEFHLGGVELIVTLDQAQRIKDGAEAHGLKVCALP